MTHNKEQSVSLSIYWPNSWYTREDVLSGISLVKCFTELSFIQNTILRISTSDIETWVSEKKLFVLRTFNKNNNRKLVELLLRRTGTHGYLSVVLPCHQHVGDHRCLANSRRTCQQHVVVSWYQQLWYMEDSLNLKRSMGWRMWRAY